ncbi:TIGR02281 family clan AA aspartic protease [Aureimonas flava]|uniref:TIGR02281 family clan AA aspartic protease n=1 Tax=Aureimonas flava TaxID=2320271 RepID=A0A3A1WS66_9HYPH|nr:TIGR02281 family clan AA aspartic protease [Aureimonas flava]RIY00948.1 TIGR02281 family clan AA aspartic protease [Aureimonas flava]
MSKLLPLLVGATAIALVFPSAFERYRANLVSEGEVERLDSPRPVVEAALPPATGRTVRLEAGADGHFRTLARFDGRNEDVMIDTGATYVALGEDAARRLGLRVGPSDFVYRAQTAQGSVRAALASVRRLSIGPVELFDVDVMVLQGQGPGTTLLGMSFLKRLARFQAEGGRLTLSQ